MNKLICQKCQNEITNDFNQTLVYCTNCGASIQNPLDELQTIPQISQRTAIHRNNSQTPLFLIVGGVFALGILILLGAVGGYLLLDTPSRIGETRPPPSFTPRRTSPDFPPSPPTPIPNLAKSLKIDILDEIKDEMGMKFLNFKVTNTSEYIVELRQISLSFYQDDVKVKDVSELSKFPFLKPNQTIPMRVLLFDGFKYNSVKPAEDMSVKAVEKTPEQLFLKLEFSETKLTSEMGELMYNDRLFKKLYYTVSGIVVNNEYEKMSPKIFVIFYDDKKEIVGVADGSLSGLKKGEKTKFEVEVIEKDLFGKPKTFEIIVVSDRFGF